MKTEDKQPQQPIDELGETHISWCECDECETWALALLDWEDRNPNHPDNPNSVGAMSWCWEVNDEDELCPHCEETWCDASCEDKEEN